jgi:hypothetical protein
MDRTAIVTARTRLGKSILEHSAQCSSLAIKLRLTVQNTIGRKSGILDEKPPKIVAQHSSLLSGRHATVGHIRRLHPSTKRQGWKTRQSA